MEIPAGVSFFYANNEPKSALARDLGDCRDNKGKLAKRVFTCCAAPVRSPAVFDLVVHKRRISCYTNAGMWQKSAICFLKMTKAVSYTHLSTSSLQTDRLRPSMWILTAIRRWMSTGTRTAPSWRSKVSQVRMDVYTARWVTQRDVATSLQRTSPENRI